MNTKIFRLFILSLVVISLFISTSGCMYHQEFYKKNLVLRGYKSTIFGIPIETQYVVMEIKPFDNTYDFYIKFPDGKVYRSSEMDVKTFKNLKNIIITYLDDEAYSYEYYPLPGGLLKNPTRISISSKNNITTDSFFCFAEFHCNTPQRFYFSSAKGNRIFYPMPLTHEQAVKIFGKPDKITSKLTAWGVCEL